MASCPLHWSCLVLSALGRGGTSVGALYALSDRYNTISLLFTALVCVYLVYVLSELFSRRRLAGQRFFSSSLHLKRLFVITALGLLMLNGLRANAAWKPYVFNHFSVRQEARECLWTAVRSGRTNQGLLASPSTLSCAAKLYPDVAKITSRFSGSWCLPQPHLPSQTLRYLCDYFWDSSHVNSLP
jgi:hypothetical protein